MRLIHFASPYRYNHLIKWDNGLHTNRSFETIDMDELEQRLTALITEVRQHSPNSRKRRLAMNRLLLEIQQHPKLLRSGHQNYPAALNQTLERVSLNISKFEPFSASVSESLIKWVNVYLYYRIRDLYSPEPNTSLSLDIPIVEDTGNITLLDTVAAPTLSGLDGLIESSQRETSQRIGLQLEIYIAQDPEEKLKNSSPRSCPECNCQLLSQRFLLKDPPDKCAYLARELGIPYTTVNSHWKRKCEPILQKIAQDLGYKQEQ